MESVLALEVGAAARRIFSRAIWGERRDGKWDGSPTAARSNRGVYGGELGAPLERDGAVKGSHLHQAQGTPELPSSPCTGAGLAAGPGTGSLQGLAPLLLHPGATQDQKTRSCHWCHGPGSAPGKIPPTARAGYPQLPPKDSPQNPPSPVHQTPQPC